MLSGFDDEGWWLGVEGYRGGRRSTELATKLAEKQPNSGLLLLPWGRGRGERKWSLWIVLSFFD